jgi:hypothetical protein
MFPNQIVMVYANNKKLDFGEISRYVGKHLEEDAIYVLAEGDWAKKLIKGQTRVKVRCHLICISSGIEINMLFSHW